MKIYYGGRGNGKTIKAIKLSIVEECNIEKLERSDT